MGRILFLANLLVTDFAFARNGGEFSGFVLETLVVLYVLIGIPVGFYGLARDSKKLLNGHSNKRVGKIASEVCSRFLLWPKHIKFPSTRRDARELHSIVIGALLVLVALAYGYSFIRSLV